MKKTWREPFIDELDINATAGDVFLGEKPDGTFVDTAGATWRTEGGEGDCACCS